MSFVPWTTSLKVEVEGICSFTLRQACAFEIHDIPTRDETTRSLKVTSPPTGVFDDIDLATPLMTTGPTNARAEDGVTLK
jgi:hypothetical protein